MPRWALFFIFLVLCVPANLWAWDTYIGRSVSARVEELLEGNIFTAKDEDGNTLTVRFYGIGIPTPKQPLGIEARQELGRLLAPGTRIVLTTVNEADDGIYSALVQVADRSVNNRLVAEGLAWVDRHTCKAFFCRRWHIEEHLAQTERRGIWGLNIATPPWQWGEPRAVN